MTVQDNDPRHKPNAADDHPDFTKAAALNSGWWVMPGFVIGACTIAALIWGAFA